MNIDEMTRKDFDKLPLIKRFNEEIIYDALIILPTRIIHDSGYRCMDFIAVRENKPICRLSGCSDVINIEGIGGFGKDGSEKYHACPKMIPPIAWSIDCLPKSGLLRIWPSNRNMVDGGSLSSFEIYSINKAKE